MMGAQQARGEWGETRLEEVGTAVGSLCLNSQVSTLRQHKVLSRGVTRCHLCLRKCL